MLPNLFPFNITHWQKFCNWNKT